MTVLYSTLLASTGFEHGFGTRLSTPVDIPESVYIPRQVHGERIVVLSENPESRIQNPKGLNLTNTSIIVVQGLPDDPFRLDEGDAVITDMPEVTIGIMTADCLPLLLVDAHGKAVCAMHCGWRSLAAGLATKAVKALLQVSNSRIENLRAALGPGIGVCHYEVGDELRNAFNGSVHGHSGFFEKRGGNLHLDLDTVAKSQLLSAGMRTGDIEKVNGCTVCDRDLFWSYRAGDQEERMLSWVTAK